MAAPIVGPDDGAFAPEAEGTASLNITLCPKKTPPYTTTVKEAVTMRRTFKNFFTFGPFCFGCHYPGLPCRAVVSVIAFQSCGVSYGDVQGMRRVLTGPNNGLRFVVRVYLTADISFVLLPKGIQNVTNPLCLVALSRPMRPLGRLDGSAYSIEETFLMVLRLRKVSG